ncbi:MAG: tetratricopeptide repeat protein [Bacteroidota bacterium]
MTHSNTWLSFLFKKSFTTTFVFWIFFVVGISTDLAAQNLFKDGKKLYEQRHANANSYQADSTNINKAIGLLQAALEKNIKPEESAIYLLRSYYFKGVFTDLPQNQQKEVFRKGRALGEKMMDRFPDSVPIKFWYAANVGRWADVHSFARAATSGISKKLREVCEDIITNDSTYQGGGGYRILAQVHFYSPNIPIIMGWPSKDKAFELIKKAMKIDPNHPSNRVLYAQLLLEFDQKKDARDELLMLNRMTPRETHIVEDRYVRHRADQLLEEHF